MPRPLPVLLTMNERLTDQDVRAQALQPEQSFIIQAPAGSGKTGLLIKRYLRLLSLVDNPEEIIAITFTRKAAAEMQGRILQALQRAATGIAPETEHELETHTLAAAALDRDRLQNWQIILNPGRLRIQTIDSLCASLTRQMPLLSMLGSQPEIVEDALPLYEQAAINTLAELETGAGWSDAIANLVFHLDNDLPRIKQLIVDMLLKRDQWLGYVTRQHDRQDMEQSLARLIDEQLQQVNDSFPDEYKDPCVELLAYAAENLSTQDPEHPLSCCVSLPEFPDASSEQLPVWQSLQQILLTSQNNWRKRLDVKCGFPAASETQLSLHEKERRQAMKLKMQELIKELQQVDGLLPSLTIISLLPSRHYKDTEWQIVNALCELLKLAAAQLELLFAMRNQMDFIGLANKAQLALGEDEAPTELARHLDYQIKHLLVDEFQDVSVSQARLIKSLIREWSLDDDRSLFLVGDPMQSIYRFREADVSIFIQTFHDGHFGSVPLEALKLSVNFRARQALLAWVNDCFQSLFPSLDKVSAGAVSYSHSDAFDQSVAENNVRVYPIYGSAFEKEAQQVNAIVAELKADYPQDKIAILVRGRAHLREIAPALRQSGQRFRAIDIERLDTRPAIQDLLALTRAWLFPADRVAWLACLRAPWCGLELESLYLLCHQQQDRLLFDCLNDDDLLSGLAPDQRQRAQHFRDLFNQAKANRQRTTLRVAIESLWCQLGGPATLAEHSELMDCDTYFALLARLETGGTINRLEELLEAVDQLYAAADEQADNQLQVMTIHKAKGLEFDHVILPGLGRPPRVKQIELLVWLLRERESTEDLVLAPIREAGDSQSDIYQYINHTDKEKQHYEDQRLLYVASTRSRKTLHLLGHTKLKQDDDEVYAEPSARSLLAFLWPAVEDVYQKHCPDSLDENAAQTVIAIAQENRRLVSDWLLPELPEGIAATDNLHDELQQDSAIEFEWAGETIKHIGSVVHRIIQWIAEEGLESWQPERVQNEQENFGIALRQLGVPDVEVVNAVNQVSQAVMNMLSDERGRWILSDGHKAVQNEYSVSGLLDQTLINAVLDRTFIDSDEVRWIIDYKTSRHEGPNREQFLDREQERYQAQLQRYGLLMQQLGEKNIRLALYFPLLKGWREWPLS